MGCQLIKVGIFFINLFTIILQNAMIEHGKIRCEVSREYVQ